MGNFFPKLLQKLIQFIDRTSNNSRSYRENCFGYDRGFFQGKLCFSSTLLFSEIGILIYIAIDTNRCLSYKVFICSRGVRTICPISFYPMLLDQTYLLHNVISPNILFFVRLNYHIDCLASNGRWDLI